ncbi:hypothetical protein EJ08DRAFT_730820 [Tothia fuscella]|uniref:Uncharacterized protein n=1 Tax=Tothia fuscella TaxID=1048955 RepID=A0A9P4NZQ7_9PEZI|nr:hypothetical protein EJ08DRAFT_730820 [Tothia fuscella]
MEEEQPKKSAAERRAERRALRALRKPRAFNENKHRKWKGEVQGLMAEADEYAAMMALTASVREVMGQSNGLERLEDVSLGITSQKRKRGGEELEENKRSRVEGSKPEQSVNEDFIFTSAKRKHDEGDSNVSKRHTAVFGDGTESLPQAQSEFLELGSIGRRRIRPGKREREAWRASRDLAQGQVELAGADLELQSHAISLPVRGPCPL